MKRFTTMAIIFALLFGCGMASAQVNSTWARVDADQNGTIFWLGGKLGPSMVHDFVYTPSNGSVEGDFGYTFKLYKDAFDIIPMIGGIFNPVTSKTINYVPQLYWYSAYKNHYSELWLVDYMDPNKNSLNTLWILGLERYKVCKYINVGPQFEILQDLKANENLRTLAGFGIRMPYGKTGTIDLSASRDTKNKVNTGRMTFIFNL